MWVRLLHVCLGPHAVLSLYLPCDVGDIETITNLLNCLTKRQGVLELATCDQVGLTSALGRPWDHELIIYLIVC